MYARQLIGRTFGPDAGRAYGDAYEDVQQGGADVAAANMVNVWPSGLILAGSSAVSIVLFGLVIVADQVGSDRLSALCKFGATFAAFMGAAAALLGAIRALVARRLAASHRPAIPGLAIPGRWDPMLLVGLALVMATLLV